MVNGQLWPDSASARGNSASLDVLTNSLEFPFYTSSTPPDSTSSSWKNRGTTPTQLAESQERLGESQLDSDHMTTLSNSPWLTGSTPDSSGPLSGRSKAIFKLLAESAHRTRRVHSMQSLKLASKVRSTPTIHRSGPPRLIHHVKS